MKRLGTNIKGSGWEKAFSRPTRRGAVPSFPNGVRLPSAKAAWRADVRAEQAFFECQQAEIYKRKKEQSWLDISVSGSFTVAREAAE